MVRAASPGAVSFVQFKKTAIVLKFTRLENITNYYAIYINVDEKQCFIMRGKIPTQGA
jgi:hypothetical protein